MLNIKWLLVNAMPFMQTVVNQAPLIYQPCMILGGIYFWFMMGKSS
jgi:hypothetical protein